MIVSAGAKSFKLQPMQRSSGSPYVGVGLREHQEVKATGGVMGEHLACLRGWHPALASAELGALLPKATRRPTASQRWIFVDGTTPPQRNEALRIASGLQCFLEDGFIHPWNDDEDAFLSTVEAYLIQHPVSGSVAVKPWRQEGKISDLSTSALAGKIGGIMVRAEYDIDLETPDYTLALIADGTSASIACGWMEGGGNASFGSGERRAAERPFFKPVSLDPRLARLAVNLAAGPLGTGPVVDPMTGTGGFVIEASLSGRDGMGIDIHSEMVEGARTNLTWAHGEDESPTCSIERGDATRLGDALPEDWHGSVSGFVLDPPYGRNSQGSMESQSLLKATLESSYDVASHDAGFVLILPIKPMGERPNLPVSFDEDVELLSGSWPELLLLLESCGWAPQSAHVEHVHKSLSRLILLARYVPRD
jgi:putative methyltransferase (TIGR01177 family)